MGANYGSGSAQQVITSQASKDGDNLWILREGERNNRPCPTGLGFKCGDKVRFEHNQTGKNLHSHANYKAPLSQRQEVSGFGDDGMGDQGDDWELVCNEVSGYGPIKKLGEQLTGKDVFFLKHANTGCMLISDSTFRYTHQNCPRCPIVNHMEVSCVENAKQKTSLWRVDSGFFFPKRQEDEPKEDDDEEELVNDEL